MISFVYYPIYLEQIHLDLYLDSDPEDAPIYTGHLLFNVTKSVTWLFIAQSLLLPNLP